MAERRKVVDIEHYMGATWNLTLDDGTKIRAYASIEGYGRDARNEMLREWMI